MKIFKHFIILFVFTSSALANGFTDSHDSTKSYAHPSFVLYNDEPYRTLKAVPVNTLITNTEYWVSLKTEASQQTLPQGETPPETDTSQLTNSVPNNDTPLVAPSFSVGSTDAVNYQENGSSSVYTADATGALSYSISSGDDIALFEINSATGVLTFKSSPDYETPTDQGSNNNYSVTITATNSAGTAELSLSVVVTDDTEPEDNDTIAPDSDSRLINLSTRGYVGTGDSVMIAGFIVSGEGSTKVTIRALGPTIAAAPYNVAGTISDPVLTIVDGSGQVVASNDNWADFPTASDIQSDGRAPSGSSEAVVQISVTKGNYTAIVTGAGGGTGVSLVEVYDEGTGGSSIELSNLSTRGYVGTGDSVMIAGFIVGGDVGSSSTVTVRALGPTIAAPPFNVAGTITDPVLTIVDGTGTVVASVDNWESSTSASAITSSSRNPSNTVESAHQLSVSPGNYTAIVTGAGGNTGVSLIEVYKE